MIYLNRNEYTNSNTPTPINIDFLLKENWL
jgi:hypothetical protein